MAAKVTPMKRPASLTPEEIDELAILHEKLGPMRKRQEQLKEKNEAANPKLKTDPNATMILEGKHYLIDVSKRGPETKVAGIEKIYKLLGLKAFFEFVKRCQVTQKALDASLPAGTDRELFLVTAQTGHRNYSVTRKFTGETA
jgi:hypothetical protein